MERGRVWLILAIWMYQTEHCVCVSFFFFSSRRRHTRFDCDWSSDVCSSDLLRHARDARAGKVRVEDAAFRRMHADGAEHAGVLRDELLGHHLVEQQRAHDVEAGDLERALERHVTARLYFVGRTGEVYQDGIA